MSYDHEKQIKVRATVHHYWEPRPWEATPKWHPRRVMWKQNWRRFLPDFSGFAYHDEGHWQYMTDVEMAHWGLRQAAGLPDPARDDAYEPTTYDVVVINGTYGPTAFDMEGEPVANN